MFTSNQNTPTVGTEYPAQNPTITETVPTIYASVSGDKWLTIMDVQVHNVTAKRIVVVVRLDIVAQQYWPTYTLNRADLETGKPCSRKFTLRRPKYRPRKGDPMEFTTSHHIIEFSFSKAVANAARLLGHDFEMAISKIHEGSLMRADYFLQQFKALGMPIPADNELRLCVENLASMMASIPTEEVPKVG